MYPLHTAPPSVPSYTSNTPILQNYPAPPTVPPSTVYPSPIIVPVTPHHSTCKTKGALTSKMFQDEIYSPHGAQVFLSTLPVPTQSYNDVFLAYLADLNTYYDTGIINCSGPRGFVAKTRRKSDSRNPSYNESMTGPHAREYKIAMHKDISQLTNQSKWCMINHNTLQKLPNGKYPVLPVTQALNIKRLSD